MANVSFATAVSVNLNQRFLFPVLAERFDQQAFEEPLLQAPFNSMAMIAACEIRNLEALAAERHSIETAENYKLDEPKPASRDEARVVRRLQQLTIGRLLRYARNDDAMNEILKTTNFNLMKGLSAVAEYDSNAHLIKKDVLAFTHRLLDWLATFHELIHARIVQKRGPPVNETQRKINNIVATFFELESLFAQFPGEWDEAVPWLRHAQLQSRAYIELVSQMPPSLRDWRDVKEIVAVMAKYVVGDKVSEDILSGSLSLIYELRWEQLLKWLGLETDLMGQDLDDAMKMALKKTRPKEEYVLFAYAVHKIPLQKIILNRSGGLAYFSQPEAVTTERVRQVKNIALRRLKNILQYHLVLEKGFFKSVLSAFLYLGLAFHPSPSSTSQPAELRAA
jgi:hypothetical protein